MKQTVGKSSTICSYQSELIVFKYGLGYTTLKIVIHKNIITVITLQNSSKNTVSNEMHWISQNIFSWNLMKTTGKIFHQNVIIPEMADFLCVNLYSDDILFYSKSHERCCLFNSSGRICLPVP